MITEQSKTTLRRELGLVALVIYGVGDILGAGIYALVGKIAGVAGPASWLAFALSLGVAALTAFSYAELGRRFPRSGGEAYFCQVGFGIPAVALLVGWLVLCSGVMSLATVSRAFGEHVLGLFQIQAMPLLEGVCVVLLIGGVSLVNFRGIRESSRMNIVCTVIEAGGLLLVLSVGLLFISQAAPAQPLQAAQDIPVTQWPTWFAISQAAALAFFAFIGFEDMVNVAEEVRSPERNLPLAIILALGITGSVYIAVAWVATAVVPPAQLAASKAPLLEVVRTAAPVIPPWSFAAVALFAVANTGLLNCVMASRLLYGMAHQRLMPAWLGKVHERTRTPHFAILAVFCAATALSLSGTLVYLAGTASLLLLLVFCSVNLSLVMVKRGDQSGDGKFSVPMFVPVIGAIASIVLASFLPRESLFTAALILAAGLVVVAVHGYSKAAK